MSPELARDLIREANRHDATAEDVLDLFYLTEMLLDKAQTDEDFHLITGTHVYNFWRESFDEEP